MPRRSSSAASEAWPVIATGRVWGTSPSSAPSDTTTCTPSASARSTMLRAEGAPAHRRLDALHEHQVARRARRRRLEDLDRRPGDLALLVLAEPDARAVGLEVVELLRVDLREAARAERARPGTRPRLEAASPASFQPWNAHTIAGALRPSGRRSQMRGCIRTTVHHGAMAAPSQRTARRRSDDRHAARRGGGRRGVRVHAQGAPDLPRGQRPT